MYIIMPFNSDKFVNYASDVRYGMLQKPINIDKDSRAYEITVIPPATPRGIYQIPEKPDEPIMCYNNSGALHYIDMTSASDCKPNMMGCSLCIKYQAIQVRGCTTDVAGAVTTTKFLSRPVNPLTIAVNNGVPEHTVGESMTWNPCCMINTASLKLNQSQTPVEQYISGNQLQHITTQRYLNKYKREALEDNDSTFFTPCLESSFDTNFSLSDESVVRAHNWFGSGGAFSDNPTEPSFRPVTNQIIIPLADIFESCENCGIWTNTNRFRLEFTFKTPDTIAFMATGATDLNGTAPAVPAIGTPNVYPHPYVAPTVNTSTGNVYGGVKVCITDLSLIYDTARMQAMQAIETATEKQEGTIENIAYYENAVIPQKYTANNQMVATAQRDVQQVIFGFPAIGVCGIDNHGEINVPAHTGINPIQYWDGRLTSLQVSYGGDTPLKQPLTFDSNTRNVLAYTEYKKSCGADRNNIVSVAIPYLKFPFYNLYHIPIYNPILPHRSNDPKDIRITTSCNVGNSFPQKNDWDTVLIMRKLAGAQVSSDGTCEKLN
jgi:hypothetical protein